MPINYLDMPRTNTPGTRLPAPVRYLLVLAVGLGLAKAMTVALPLGYFASMKLAGKIPYCPWDRIRTLEKDADVLKLELDHYRAVAKKVKSDAELGLDLIETPERSFWVKQAGKKFNGQALISYLLAEHAWIRKTNERSYINKGDVVIDCGGHVGVFTHNALLQGAAKVIAVEPDPGNITCFRRNFEKELADGRVVLITKGVWKEETTLELFELEDNSGVNSVIWKRGKKVEIPVTTLDKIVAAQGLTRVDVIKMDIEGAEREALRGGMGTIKKLRPRIMLDAYHLPDDSTVLPEILRSAHMDYRLSCGPCQLSDHGQTGLTPHSMWFE